MHVSCRCSDVCNDPGGGYTGWCDGVADCFIGTSSPPWPTPTFVGVRAVTANPLKAAAGVEEPINNRGSKCCIKAELMAPC